MGHGGGPWHGRVKRQDSLHFEFSPLIFLSPDRRDIGKLLSGQLAQRSRLSLVKLAKHSRASQCLPSTLCSYLCLTDAYSNGLALPYATSPVWCSWRSQSFLCYSLTNGLWQGLAGPPTLQINASGTPPLCGDTQLGFWALGCFSCQFQSPLSLPEAPGSCIMQRF